MKGASGRADLVRALDLGIDDFEEAARLLGWRVRPTRSPAPLPLRLKEGAESEEEPTEEVSPPDFVPTPIPFLLTYAYEPAPETNKKRRSSPPLAPQDHTPRAVRPPRTPPLQAWPRLWPWLRDVLSRSRDRAELDVSRLVDRWSRGELVSRLPRRRDRGLVSRAWVLVDRDPRLTPFYDDQTELCHHLRRILGRRAVVVSSYLDGPERPPRDRSGRGASKVSPNATAPVLLLGDLGSYADEMEQFAWQKITERLRRRGHRLAALIPAPRSRWAKGASLWEGRVWDRAEGPAVGENQRTERAERLLKILSPAVRIEPGLLRAVRHLLPASAADAATEVDVWEHDAVGGGAAIGFSIDPEFLEDWRSERLSESLELRRQVYELVRAWHAPLPREIEHEEALTFSRVDPDVSIPDPVSSAQAFVRKMAATDEPPFSHLGDWMRRVDQRLPKELYQDPKIGPELIRAWERYCQLDGDTKAPHDWIPTPPSDREPRAWSLRQRGESLVASRVIPSAGIPTAPGSEFAMVTAAGPELVVHRAEFRSERASLDLGAELPVPPFGSESVEVATPSWAVGAGEDEYGHFADIEVAGVRARLRWISPGTFVMGSPEDEAERRPNETQREVTFAEGFWMADTAVTQELWEGVMGENPSHFKGAKRPVEQVSWDDTQTFLAKIGDDTSDPDLRLPTEEEWEYACRAGTTTPFSFGETITPDQVNYNGNYPYANGAKGKYRGETVDVKSLPANRWGLFEMHGNVREWCANRLSEDARGASRVVRGGSWFDYARYCRSAFRLANVPGLRYIGLGFRLVRGHDPAEPSPRDSGTGERSAEARGTSRRGSGADGGGTADAPRPIFAIATDQGRWRVGSITQPKWASGIGRDRFGLWITVDLAGVPMRMRAIPPGRFWMGSPETEEGRDSDETLHEVVLTKGYWVAETPTTQAVWEAVMGENPSHFQSPDRPVETVSFGDVERFLAATEARSPGLDLRLPTEAEWEHACRAGTTTGTYAGDMKILGTNNAPLLDEIAWYGGNCEVDPNFPNAYDAGWGEKQYEFKKGGSQPVRGKKPNHFGLYDMLGNVWEWCSDFKGDYSLGLAIDPTGAKEGASRVVRGGSWLDYAGSCRSACRDASVPGSRDNDLGFRLVRGHDPMADP